jgi:hypothetical protein
MPTAQPNNYYSLFYPIQPGDTDRKFKLVRPTILNWDDLNITIRPFSGQVIRVRETGEVLFTATEEPISSAIWNNRFTQEVFIGHYQITRNGSYEGTTIVTERGNIIGTKLQNTNSYSWHFQREYDLNLHLNKTDKNAAYLSAITNCNAYLAPAPVPNLNINYANFDKYVRIAYGIGTGDLGTAGTLIDTLTAPTIAGYTFPDSVLFRGVNNIPTINLEGFEISTRLGDIELWVHPDWMIDPAFVYTFEVINYKVLAQTLDQFPDGTECNFNGGLDFP